MAKLKYTLMTDVLFKMLFIKHPDLLRQLVCELLGVSIDSINEFNIRNPEIPPDFIGDKFCRLDINMIVDGQHVNLEVQVANEGNFTERTLYNWAREYSSALLVGEDYSKLPRTVCINIIGFSLFACSEYRSLFMPLETTRHSLLSDKMCIYFYELDKLPGKLDGNNLMLMWLSLFRAKTDEDLERIKSTEVLSMNKAVNSYYAITASSEFREKQRMWEKARRDEAQAMLSAEMRGIISEKLRLAKKLMSNGASTEDIIDLTELTREEVDNLVQTV